MAKVMFSSLTDCLFGLLLYFILIHFILYYLILRDGVNKHKLVYLCIYHKYFMHIFTYALFMDLLRTVVLQYQQMLALHIKI